ncbi:MAG: hypothetical protein E5W38_25980, partial [Mesorhizobium sp.]
MKLIDLGLYQRLLALAVDQTRGKGRSNLQPAFVRTFLALSRATLNLYSRLQGFEIVAAIDAFADELKDRFGPPPTEGSTLLNLARLKLSAALPARVKIGAGPVAIAIDFARTRPTDWKRPDCTR